jgi:hypothetical protein
VLLPWPIPKAGGPIIDILMVTLWYIGPLLHPEFENCHAVVIRGPLNTIVIGMCYHLMFMAPYIFVMYEYIFD